LTSIVFSLQLLTVCPADVLLAVSRSKWSEPFLSRHCTLVANETVVVHMTSIIGIVYVCHQCLGIHRTSLTH